MRVLAVSDLHGDLDAAHAALDLARPDLLVCCGDWGDPEQVDLPRLEAFTARLPVYTVFGNHDPLEALARWRNRDGSPVLLANGERRLLPAGLALAGISGIWAKSHRRPYYITDAEVDSAAARVAAAGPVDLLLSHGCPSGVADLTWQNRHAGQACFLRAFRTIRPRVYLTGHLHRAQEYRTRAGQIVRNVGETRRGDATLISFSGGGVEIAALTIPGRGPNGESGLARPGAEGSGASDRRDDPET